MLERKRRVSRARGRLSDRDGEGVSRAKITWTAVIEYTRTDPKTAVANLESETAQSTKQSGAPIREKATAKVSESVRAVTQGSAHKKRV